MYNSLLEALKSKILEKYELSITSGWKDNTELVLLLLDSLCCPYLNERLDSSDKANLILASDKIYNSILQPITSEALYIKNIKDCLNAFCEMKSVKKLKRERSRKVLNCSYMYITELKKSIYLRKDIYLREEQLVNALLDFKSNFSDNVDKYAFKKRILAKIGIRTNQTALIEQEKYWFTKWTDFDFGLELLAKRSQEVY